METKNLIRMANDIGSFFVSYPDEEQAKRDTAGHIQKFWGRDMRKQIKEYVKSLNEIEIKAMIIARDHLETSFNIVKSIGFQNGKKIYDYINGTRD